VGITITGYLFFCFLYYIFRPNVFTDKETNAKNKFRIKHVTDRFGSSLGIIVVNQMQVFAIVLSTVQWDPEIPTWLVKMLEMLGNIVSIDFGGLLSSPDCVASMDPVTTWLFHLALPWSLAFLFLVWFGFARLYFKTTKKYDAGVIHTILHSVVQVLLIGLYSTVVKQCFQIFDCTAPTLEKPSVLVLDPTYQCSEVLGYQVLGALVFLFWAFIPFFVIAVQLFRHKSKGTLATAMKQEASTFYILYGWAAAKYIEKSRVAYLWEMFNAFVKVFMVAGSFMYGPPISNNRTILQTCPIIVSLIGHGVVRPYKDRAGNYIVLIFCLIDLLGVFATGNGSIIQYIYIVTTIVVLLFVFVLALKSMRHTMKEEKLSEITNKATFTPLERILLFPFLVLFIWPIKKAILTLYPILLLTTEELEFALELDNKVENIDKDRDAQSEELRTWGCPRAEKEEKGTEKEEKGVEKEEKEEKEKMKEKNGVSPEWGGGGDNSGGGSGIKKKKKKKHRHHHHHHHHQNNTKVVPILMPAVLLVSMCLLNIFM